ncbi:MAG: type II secretion system minor pseudopilin GspK [Thermodesulfobacteriota bacterium]
MLVKYIMSQVIPCRDCSFVSFPQSRQQGAILIMVLMLLSMLVVVTMESMRLMQVNQVSSRVFSDSLRAKSLARSAITLAESLLLNDAKKKANKDEENVDHYGETWANFLNQDEIASPSLGLGEVNGTILDEQSKFPINYLVDHNGDFQQEYKAVLERLLMSPPFSKELPEVKKILESLKDWIDEDKERTGEFGAESPYYHLENKDYSCPNRPIKYIGELVLIRGIDKELYTGSENEPGLKDLFTVYSNGKININTAPKEILAAMVNPGISRETAMQFAEAAIDYRRQSRHFDFLYESDWYLNRLAGYSDVQFPSQMVTTASNNFSVLINATSGSACIAYFCVLERNLNDKKYNVKRLLTEVQ